jgi:protein-S-isoprenylcysteine O-methyltransferase Ste14
VSRLNNCIPPPLVLVAFGGLAWLLARLFEDSAIHVPERVAVAAAIALCALVTVASGLYAFRRARTTVNPLKPHEASALVDGGIYRITRNPMYLGLLGLLVAWTIWLANLVSLAALPGFVLYMNRFQIGPEERALERLFGEAFRRYSRSVRRWI